MADKPMKIPGPDHPISIEANPSRVVVKVGKVNSGPSKGSQPVALTYCMAVFYRA
jgi:hypothetical protein